EPETGTVTGTINYRERIALSPEAVATVTLEDVSRADAPATVIARQEITNPGAPPIAFEIEYPLNAIDERMSYTVRAQIRDRGRLMLTTDTHAPVLTRGGGDTVDLALVGTNRKPNVSPTAPAKKSAPDNILAGMLHYVGDAPLFRDCRNNKVYPVARDGKYEELERAYSISGIEQGEELMVNVEGRLIVRPSVNPNDRKVKLLVESFIAVYPDESCSTMVDEPLVNTYWKLVEVAGNPVTTPENQREAHMVLAIEESRVQGNAGCNRFFGSYEVDGDSVSFSQTGSTMMACPEGMDTEKAFLAALEKVDRYEIEGQTLAVYGGDEVLARFEAVHLP
ncbi:MAG: YbaY family lipoprotein, partial [Xanthomonadales bacterium]